MKIVRLLKVIKLKQIFDQLDEMISLKRYLNFTLTVFRLIFFMVAIAHWVACIWNFVGRVDNGT